MTWEIDDPEGVYLTFDDGPTPGITEYILDDLRKYEAKATFFCLGKNVESYPALFESIIAEGHKAGNHTYSHLKGWKTPTKDYIEEIRFSNRFVDSDLFRPPYGRITRWQAKELQKEYRLIMGNIVSQDYSPVITPEKCLDNVIKHVRPGSIIVFHDSLKAEKNMRYALPRTLDHIASAGLEFKLIHKE